MPKRSLNSYLQDIIDTIDTLLEKFSGCTIIDLKDITKKWAVERGISIIGEALYQANNLDRKLLITDISKIIATRHILIHEYEYVDVAILVDIINNHLPVLKAEVNQILKNENRQDKE
jgi:uncharacterized protein with HEPN domain